MKPILYSVEDDQNIAYVIQKALENAGYVVQSFEITIALQDAIKRERPALILLDIMLPNEDGISFLKTLKQAKETATIPVIFLTAKSTEMDKVIGLDLGADDYITKPFGVLELIARVNACLRRNVATETVTFFHKDLTLNLMNRQVLVGKESIALTLKEFDLLKALIEHKNTVLKRTELLDSVWGYDYVGESRTIDMHIKTLRQKLKHLGPDIKTIRGIGYLLED